MDLFLLIIVLAVAAVVVVLTLGLGTFAKGGAFNAKYGNKMMRLRLAAQFVAVLLIAAYVYFGGTGGR